MLATFPAPLSRQRIREGRQHESSVKNLDRIVPAQEFECELSEKRREPGGKMIWRSRISKLYLIDPAQKQ
ncbi:MAG: hypothetical protein AAB333_01815 [Pseudomonadota bacterium]